ncbi:MAG TPA: hypothetical protein VMA98_09515 [Candidatus Acidoferrales bacterium]|nr:hypothetical protein [Candidatus Acidoferrales bacterium]
MVGSQTELLLRHTQLHEDAAALFRALDDRDAESVRSLFTRFIRDLRLHLSVDLNAGYRLLMRHQSEFVRRMAERVIQDQGLFPQQFAVLCARWERADAQMLLSQSFRDELETLVSNLLKRIRVEERLLSALTSVA